VLWSLLAVPSLTILISNMGDTIIKGFTDLTNWIASLTVLPGEGGIRATLRKEITGLLQRLRKSAKSFTAPGVFGDAPLEHEKKISHTAYENEMLDRLAQRLGNHVDKEPSNEGQHPVEKLDSLEDDIRFYHYVLARECRNMQKDLDATPPKSYEWYDWEYYLKLMGNEDDPRDFPGQKQPDILVPDTMRAPNGMLDGAADSTQECDSTEFLSVDNQKNSEVPDVDGNVDRRTSADMGMDTHRKLQRRHRPKDSDADSDYLLGWSWLSNSSPLMSEKSEAQWILDRLSAALERELNRQRKGFKRKPPITLADARRPSSKKSDEKDDAEREESSNEEQHLKRAYRDEA
jgi:potassium channel subfamily K, other eukaryote